ncbi:MAG TPA: hemerythrin domain-containing protein [Hyphomicrobiaceae bacterium]
MEIFELLKQDHDEAKALLTQICESEDGKERGELFKELRKKLLAHAHAEQKVLYEPMKKQEETKDIALEAVVEHEVVERLVEDLSRSRSRDSDAWLARATVLKETLEHHIKEEEGEMFEKARSVFDGKTLEKMAEQIQKAKERELKKAA